VQCRRSAIDLDVTRYSTIWDALLDYWSNKMKKKKNGTRYFECVVLTVRLKGVIGEQ
jgi:hypothetical protein